MTFVELFEESNAASNEGEIFELLEAAFEGWAPAEGNLEVWLVKAFARVSAGVQDQATVLSAAAFKTFGESIVGVPPILAAPATVSSTWVMVDTAGYTIPSGTQVAIQATGDSSVGFLTTEDVVVAPGEPTATVLLRAVEVGTGGNGLTEDPTLIDALSFVSSIETEGVSSGGVDEETEDAYLDRLVAELRLLSLSLIVESDFATDALSVAGVARAKALPAWNAEKDEAEALAVSVYPVDAAGHALGSGVKEELQARQQAKVPSGVNVYVGDPTYSKVKVKTSVIAKTGFDPEAVKAAVEARLAEYLDPANWGIPDEGDASSNGGWINRTTVYHNELISEIDRVAGVDRVESVELAKGVSALGTSNVALDGTVALTEPGTLTVEVA